VSRTASWLFALVASIVLVVLAVTIGYQRRSRALPRFVDMALPPDAELLFPELTRLEPERVFEDEDAVLWAPEVEEAPLGSEPGGVPLTDAEPVSATPADWVEPFDELRSSAAEPTFAELLEVTRTEAARLDAVSSGAAFAPAPEASKRVAERDALPPEIAAISRTLLDALLRGDPKTYAAHFLDDGLSLPGRGMVVRGRPAILAAMTETFYRLRFAEADTSTLDVRLNGETALETGKYRYVVASNRTGVRNILAGRYITVWKRLESEWKVALEACQPDAIGE